MFHRTRKTVRHALEHAEPNPSPQTRNRATPVLGPFQSMIDQILADDEEAPPKWSVSQITSRLLRTFCRRR
jgi:hypothetical protein